MPTVDIRIACVEKTISLIRVLFSLLFLFRFFSLSLSLIPGLSSFSHIYFFSRDSLRKFYVLFSLSFIHLFRYSPYFYFYFYVLS